VNSQGDSVFWTAPVPDSDVKVNFGAGKGELKVDNLAAEDYFNLPNASIPGNEVDATVSLDVVWGGPITRRVSVSDAANGFAGNYVENQATITWSASNSLGFSFVANPGNFSTSVPEAGPFAELGQERNGIFFDSGSTDKGADAVVTSALAGSPAVSASTGTGFAVPPRLATGPIAITAGSSQSTRVAPGPVQPPAGAANAPALDQLFADLSGALAETL
jgi:hypothetical protein